MLPLNSHCKWSSDSKNKMTISIYKPTIAILTVTTIIILMSAWVQPTHSEILRPGTDSYAHNQLMVAIYCGSKALYHNQYLNESKKWKSDHDSRAICTKDKQKILDYCRKVYPNKDIRNIVESSKTYKIDNWCRVGQKKCKSRLSVKPYRCLEGAFQSDALLVPERCMFDHVHNKSICESWEQWNLTATSNCFKREMKLQSYAMLQPCGVGIFSGVEFVCCPLTFTDSTTTVTSHKPNASSTETDKHSYAESSQGILSWPKSKYHQNPKLNEIKTDGEFMKNSFKVNHNDEANEGDDDSSGEDEYEEDEYEEDDDDEYDDDSSSWSGPSGSSSTTSTTTTTTTTTTERPIDFYLGHFDLVHEHDEFRRAEKAVENDYRDKITQVMKEWSELEEHYQDMKLKDPSAAEEFKKKMTQRFQRTVEALEEEGAAERRQLISMHSQRVMTIINRRKKAAMDCLTQALDRIPPKTRQVEKCIVRLLKALEKDRTHTLHQYKHLLNANTRDALREKNIILEHLVTLNRAANQSIAMLDRSPILVDKLKSKIIVLWHNLRNMASDETISRDSELKLMERYEEEVAQRKMERERQKLIEQEAIQDAPQESPVDKAKQQTDKHQQIESDDADDEQPQPSQQQKEQEKPTTKVDKVIEAPAAPVVESKKVDSSPKTSKPIEQQKPSQPKASTTIEAQSRDDFDNEIHYEMNPTFAHIKADAAHHDLTYSVKREPYHKQFRWGNSAYLAGGAVAVALTALAILGVTFYRKNSNRTYRNQGFFEVGQSANNEEKNVTNMQINGYENPTYKYYEAQA